MIRARREGYGILIEEEFLERGLILDSLICDRVRASELGYRELFLMRLD